MSGEVEQLEQQFCEWLGVQGAVATGYGRGALWLAMELALDGKPGLDVLLPDFVCAQVPEAVRRAGGRPVYFPVRRDLTVDERAFEATITRNTRAAIAVHYYGRVLLNIQRLADVCRRRHVLLIEDCALALGARLDGRLAGRFGDLAAFSFTKSDWCYGGGMLATPVRDWAARLRSLREEKCRPAARLARCYGWLRRIDFAANVPGRARFAGWAGRWTEKALSFVEPSLAGNFYDAGRFDAAMPAFAARRARRILSALESTMARRRAVRERLWAELQKLLIIPGHAAAGHAALFPLRGDKDPGDTGSYLLLEAREGHSADWIARADAQGWTLRHSWPVYQSQGAKPTPDAEWLRDRLLVLEVV